MTTDNKTDELSAEERARIESMPLVDMLQEWRFAPIGHFQKGDPRSDYFQGVMAAKRAADPAGWVAASKELSR